MKFDRLTHLLTRIPGLSWLWLSTNSKHDETGLSPLQDPSLQTATPTPISLTVLQDGGNWTSGLLHGIMFEEMDHSGDGGIHGQLLRNNGFQGWDAGLTAYKPLGDVVLAQDINNPLSESITSTLSVTIAPRPQTHTTSTEFVGFANTGYNGIPVSNVEYYTSFWMMGDYTGDILVRLVGSRSGNVYGATNLSVRGDWAQFRFFEARFNASVRPEMQSGYFEDNGDNEWQVLFRADEVRGDVLNFGLVQLFPPTYKNRPNGLRDDIAREVEPLRPAFLRFPGGNNIEGLDVANRWKWNETIGPLEHRPGRQGDWHYPNTEALGLDEYMQWCEDMDMEAVLTVWDGKSYGGIIRPGEMQPYLDDILDELEYLLGPATTPYGSLRAHNGRVLPYTLPFIEIGNEDDYSGGCDTYASRLTLIHNTIHSHYPNITLIANNIDPACLPAPPIPGLMYDCHYYRNPDDLAAMFGLWDNWDRHAGGEVIVGEYGVRNFSEPDGVFWSFVQGSCAEAVHMIGLERNSDVVRMAAYAPLLQHFGFTQWSPTLLGFDSSPASLTRSTSYFVQRMFSTNRGTYVHPVQSTSTFGPVYWVATSNATSYHLKLANYGDQRQTVIVRFPAAGRGTLEMLAGPRDASNTPYNVSVVPSLTEWVVESDVYTVFLEGWGVAVLVVTVE
ncbi:alpha-N-arabinofuranosidase A [Aspergillus pseudodeflectus]|uniref:non-reducing end alpha-L-arabinofuranosidase n=1 Tax=Aspergillus pseudodeflectus TaxID=176178 RepID=A0ABR4KJT4_9EURO